MTRMIEWLERAADALGLTVERGYEVRLPEQGMLRATARVLHLGGPMGMLVFERYDDVKQVADRLVEAGFGYTILDEPRADEAFDLQSYLEMATDWGWSGPSDSKPAWFDANSGRLKS